jgi:hypothetical protein
MKLKRQLQVTRLKKSVYRRKISTKLKIMKLMMKKMLPRR